MMGYFARMYGKRSPDFVKGVLVGLQAFAWWGNGVQYVGTCGTTLEDAIRGAINDLAENPEDFDIKKIVQKGFI